MQQYPDLLIPIYFVSWIGFAYLISWLLWSFIIAPKALRDAIFARMTPLQIVQKVSPGKLTTAWTSVVSLGMGTGSGFISWKWVSEWLQFALDFKFELADALAKTLLTDRLTFEDVQAGFDRFIPPVVILASMIGLILGTMLGAWKGTQFAARRFPLTRTAFE